MAFAWQPFWIGVLAASIFALILMWSGGPDTAVAAIGVPLVLGMLGVVWETVRLRRTRGAAA